ncbi:MAG: FxDxF family PEP-CTERM protein [Comamonadaceae bacterium]
MNSFIIKSLFTGVFVAMAGSASAQTVFDFANLTYNNNVSSGFKPSNGVLCNSGDICSSYGSSPLAGGSLTFQNGGITVDAFASYLGSAFGGSGAAVVQDHENGYNGLLSGSNAVGAGLGVYHLPNDTSDDNITSGEVLKLHFNQGVTLSSIGLRSDGHNTTNWSSGATFQYSLNNATWTTGLLPASNGQFALNQTGQDFYFRVGSGSNDQFYISSVTAVPEPETYAMMLSGLGLMGFIARRRKQSASRV